MSRMEPKLNYYEDNRTQVIELNLLDPDYIIGFVLPRNRDLNISADMYKLYINNLENQELNLLQIPRINQKSKYKLDNLFREFELDNLFENADLSLLAECEDQVCLSDLVHQTHIILDESGKIVNTRSQSTKNFIANHSFLYYVRHRSSGTLVIVSKFM